MHKHKSGDDIKKEENPPEQVPAEQVSIEQEVKEEINLAEDMQKELFSKSREILDLNSQLLRLKAEFDNYRKRAEKENHRRYMSGKESVLCKLIDLMDIFSTAIDAITKTDNTRVILEGVQMLQKEFTSFVTKEGLKPIEAKNCRFDPKFHEAIGIEDSGEFENGCIIKEVQKGYIFNDEYVVRPAKVIICKKEPEKPPESSNIEGSS